MHVITHKRIKEFAEAHPDCGSALDQWYRIVKHTDYTSFVRLRQTFPSADMWENCTVFNIGGNKVRLISAIHYKRRKLYILHVLTHEEYDKEGWKEGCRKLKL